MISGPTKPLSNLLGGDEVSQQSPYLDKAVHGLYNRITSPRY